MKIHAVPSLILLAVGVLLGGLALLLLLRGLRERRRAARFLERGIETSAEVVEIEAKDVSLRAEPDTRYYPRVRFDLDGVTVEGQSMTDCPLPPPRVGDLVTIRYDPRHPSRLDLAAPAERVDAAGRTSFVMSSLAFAVALSMPVAWLVLALVVWTA